MADGKDKKSGMMKMSILEARSEARVSFVEICWCMRSRKEVMNWLVRAWEKYIFVETPTRRRRRGRGGCEEDIVSGFGLNAPGEVWYRRW